MIFQNTAFQMGLELTYFLRNSSFSLDCIAFSPHISAVAALCVQCTMFLFPCELKTTKMFVPRGFFVVHGTSETPTLLFQFTQQIKIPGDCSLVERS